LSCIRELRSFRYLFCGSGYRGSTHATCMAMSTLCPAGYSLAKHHTEYLEDAQQLRFMLKVKSRRMHRLFALTAMTLWLAHTASCVRFVQRCTDSLCIGIVTRRRPQKSSMHKLAASRVPSYIPARSIVQSLWGSASRSRIPSCLRPSVPSVSCVGGLHAVRPPPCLTCATWGKSNYHRKTNRIRPCFGCHILFCMMTMMTYA
jgi:hypothetical protein